MTLLSSGDTHIGQKRSTNQDSICLYPKRNFFAVADGMGGHNGGDIASQMSVKLLPEYIEQHIEKLEVPDLLSKAVKFVNRSIYDHGQEQQELKGMGTTITALMLNGNEMNIANIGDSRTYMISHKKLYQMTRDHSLVQEKLNIGLYDRIGAAADPQKNVLVRTVGFEPEVEVDVYHYTISKNDIFMLCSDGLHGFVSDEDIIHIINKHLPDVSASTQEQLDAAVAELIDQANANGGKDNISVIMAIVK
jgi:serine/threonine protein phosphatase PrpC